ncbi:protein timeless-like [Liolophura sinensis]|uniref:protein timeless-like n=1 Tax=Liolophura sinensis TaxID=3198878 RepID=UPI0031583ADE
MYSHDPNIPEEGRTALRMIKYNLSSMTDLRQFLVLTLRSYKSESANLSFLRDLIKTNHLLMQVLDESLHLGINPSFQMLAHVQQFGSKDIMHNFGKLLANFENNSPSLNTAILTMMHHVSGDCGKVSSLIQLSVISTFVKLCDTKYPMSVEVNDLIEYVFKTFINRMWSDPQKLAQDIFCEFSEYDEFTEEEKDLTISLYMESVDGSDLVKTVRQKLEQNGVQKSQKEISEFLTSCGFEVDQLDEDKKEDEIQFSENDGSLEAYDCTLVKNHVDKIQEAGMKSALKWIQSSLLEVCFSKLVISGFKPTTLKQMWEPMSFYCTVKKTDVPLLPFNDEQESFCKDTKVRYLLSALQFRVPSHSQDYFYVPTTWGIKDLWDKAGILGQINPEELKFSIEDLESHLSMKQEITYVDAVNFDREIHAPNTGNMGTSNKMFWARAVSKINKNLSSLSSDSPSPMIS